MKCLTQSSTSRSISLAAISLSLGFAAVPVNASSTALQVPASVPKQQLLSQKGKTVELTLVSYAVTKDAYSKIIPLFAAKWKKEKGQDVKFNQSYGGSATQARAIIDGLEADVAALALGSDIDKIQQAGLIKPGWEKEVPNQGIVTRSVVAIVTRTGNPKNIKDWADLSKPGIKIITANPKTSGIARWNFLGLWTSQLASGESKSRNFVSQVFKNVQVLTKDAREASDIFFKKDQGDVLLNYENEVILAAQKGEAEAKSTAVVPKTNISIDAPVAVVDKVAQKRGTTEAATAFVKFLFTPEAQREFTKVGFRSVNSAVAKETNSKFAKVNKLYKVNELGGWGTLQQKFFADGAVFDQIYARR